MAKAKQGKPDKAKPTKKKEVAPAEAVEEVGSTEEALALTPSPKKISKVRAKLLEIRNRKRNGKS